MTCAKTFQRLMQQLHCLASRFWQGWPSSRSGSKLGMKPSAPRASHWRFFPKNKDSCAFKSMKMCADLSSVLCAILGWVWGYIYRQTGINSVRLIDDSESNGFIFLLPSFDSNTPDLIVPALMIAVVGFLETMAVGKMAKSKRYSYDAQELLAGAANVGGFSRTVNSSARALHWGLDIGAWLLQWIACQW